MGILGILSLSCSIPESLYCLIYLTIFNLISVHLVFFSFVTTYCGKRRKIPFILFLYNFEKILLNEHYPVIPKLQKWEEKLFSPQQVIFQIIKLFWFSRKTYDQATVARHLILCLRVWFDGYHENEDSLDKPFFIFFSSSWFWPLIKRIPF